MADNTPPLTSVTLSSTDACCYFYYDIILNVHCTNRVLNL